MITLRKPRCNKKVRRARRDFNKGFAVGLEMRNQQPGEYRPQRGPWADGAREGLQIRAEMVDRRERHAKANADFHAGKIGLEERNARRSC